MDNENPLRAALISLIKDVNTAGGLIRFTDGLPSGFTLMMLTPPLNTQTQLS
jgi:hypothetical protein